MKKIMFNDRYGLTEAVLSGRKTQTRRIVPRSFFTCTHDFDGDSLVCEDMWGDWHDIRKTKYAYQVGEIVAIAQSYKDAGFNPDVLKISTSISYFILDVPISSYPGWRNKMFTIPALMPHQIRITNVRVERLQDISWDDCLKEGIYADEDPMNPQAEIFTFPNASQWWFSPKEAYAYLIDKVSGKGTWESNPFVFVYDFELVK